MVTPKAASPFAPRPADAPHSRPPHTLNLGMKSVAEPPTNTSATLGVFEGIEEREESGLLILSPRGRSAHRRVLFVNCYGGREVVRQIKAGVTPGHHLLGCPELVRLGYEVALAEPLTDFYLWRNPLPHDLRLLRATRSWLGGDGIIYCGHNVLYWLPFLRRLGGVKSKVVSLLYAREPLNLAAGHDGIIALTPAAEAQARLLAPRAKVAHLGWGVDPAFFVPTRYDPGWLLSCGIANRDFTTLSAATYRSRRPVRVVCPGLSPGLEWPTHVELVDSGPGWNTDPGKKFTAKDILQDHYPRCAAVLIILKPDPRECTANGFTNLIEAIAMGRPVIVTRTGALPGELDVEKAGCGLFVPPADPAALAQAFEIIASDSARAAEMGRAGRRLCDSHYNIHRYVRDLHAYFETL